MNSTATATYDQALKFEHRHESFDLVTGQIKADKKLSDTATAPNHQADLFKFPRDFFDLVSRFQTWRSYRKTVGELNRLSDHQLWDLGLLRADIPDAVAKMIRDGK